MPIIFYTPETPGASVEFIKPNIPDCWTPQPVKVVAEEGAEEAVDDEI